MALEKSLARTINNKSLRYRPSLENDSLGNDKNERILMVLSTQMYCQDSGQVIWKARRSQRPDYHSTVKDLPMSCPLLPSVLNKEQGHG